MSKSRLSDEQREAKVAEVKKLQGKREFKKKINAMKPEQLKSEIARMERSNNTFSRYYFDLCKAQKVLAVA